MRLPTGCGIGHPSRFTHGYLEWIPPVQDDTRATGRCPRIGLRPAPVTVNVAWRETIFLRPRSPDPAGVSSCGSARSPSGRAHDPPTALHGSRRPDHVAPHGIACDDLTFGWSGSGISLSFWLLRVPTCCLGTAGDLSSRAGIGRGVSSCPLPNPRAIPHPPPTYMLCGNHPANSASPLIMYHKMRYIGSGAFTPASREPFRGSETVIPPAVRPRAGRNRRESAEKRVTPNQRDANVLPRR